MMTKMVQLSDEAYRRLRMMKRPGESFSDAVLRLATRPDLRALRGLRPREEVDAAARIVSEIDAMDAP